MCMVTGLRERSSMRAFCVKIRIQNSLSNSGASIKMYFGGKTRVDHSLSGLPNLLSDFGQGVPNETDEREGTGGKRALTAATFLLLSYSSGIMIHQC